MSRPSLWVDLKILHFGDRPKTFLHFSHEVDWVKCQELTPKCVRLAANETNLWLFSDQISVYFGLTIHWNLIWKIPGFASSIRCQSAPLCGQLWLLMCAHWCWLHTSVSRLISCLSPQVPVVEENTHTSETTVSFTNEPDSEVYGEVCFLNLWKIAIWMSKNC